ncbi:MAG TPA: DUF721 domain-containing protein [Fimbriimonadaceae bacterium]|nr:DUF721 domain-containing protein [Fimbriimonadaceae bacterium]
MRKLGNMLKDSLGRDSILRTARAQRTMRHWEEVVGEAMAKRSWPERFEKGTVWVAVEGSAWAQELRMNKEVILARLRALSDDPTMFVDVRFGVRTIKSRPVGESDDTTISDFREHLKSLSIQEIAARRLSRWHSDESDQG